MGRSAYCSRRRSQRRREAAVDGTRSAPPARKNRTQASRPPRARPSRCVASVSTASLLTTGPAQVPKNRANSWWRAWLRSSRHTRAPVSSRSSAATLQGLEDVGPVSLREGRDPGPDRADQSPYAIRGVAGGPGTGRREIAQGHADDLGVPPLHPTGGDPQSAPQVLG